MFHDVRLSGRLTAQPGFSPSLVRLLCRLRAAHSQSREGGMQNADVQDVKTKVETSRRKQEELGR